MADTPATVFASPLDRVAASQGGGPLYLPPVTIMGAKLRSSNVVLALAAQPSGTVVWVARVPLYAVLKSIRAMTTVSLGTATLAFGNAHDTQGAIYGAAATLTAVDAETRLGPPTLTWNVPITTGYDHGGILVTPAMPMLWSPDGGSLFEDINMTVAAAALPGSGTLKIETIWAID